MIRITIIGFNFVDTDKFYNSHHHTQQQRFRIQVQDPHNLPNRTFRFNFRYSIIQSRQRSSPSVSTAATHQFNFRRQGWIDDTIFFSLFFFLLFFQIHFLIIIAVIIPIIVFITITITITTIHSPIPVPPPHEHLRHDHSYYRRCVCAPPRCYSNSLACRYHEIKKI